MVERCEGKRLKNGNLAYVPCKKECYQSGVMPSALQKMTDCVMDMKIMGDSESGTKFMVGS